MAMQLDHTGEPMEPCAFVHDTQPVAEVLHVFGDVDFPSDASFESAIDDAIQSGRDLIVNFDGCTYLGASGLSGLLRARSRYGDRVRLTAPATGIVARLLAVSNMDRVFDIAYSAPMRGLRPVHARRT